MLRNHRIYEIRCLVFFSLFFLPLTTTAVYGVRPHVLGNAHTVGEVGLRRCEEQRLSLSGARARACGSVRAVRSGMCDGAPHVLWHGKKVGILEVGYWDYLWSSKLYPYGDGYGYGDAVLDSCVD